MTSIPPLVTRQQIIDEALTWISTPYHHRACVKGVGVDCAYLLVGIARNLHIIDQDWEPEFYSVQWYLHKQEELYVQILLAQGATEIDPATAQPGDIQLFRWEAWQPAAHAGILMPQGKMVHARYLKAVRHDLLRAYQPYAAGVYAWPGVQG